PPTAAAAAVRPPKPKGRAGKALLSFLALGLLGGTGYYLWASQEQPDSPYVKQIDEWLGMIPPISGSSEPDPEPSAPEPEVTSPEEPVEEEVASLGPEPSEEVMVADVTENDPETRESPTPEPAAEADLSFEDSEIVEAEARDFLLEAPNRFLDEFLQGPTNLEERAPYFDIALTPELRSLLAETPLARPLTTLRHDYVDLFGEKGSREFFYLFRENGSRFFDEEAERDPILVHVYEVGGQLKFNLRAFLQAYQGSAEQFTNSSTDRTERFFVIANRSSSPSTELENPDQWMAFRFSLYHNGPTVAYAFTLKDSDLGKKMADDIPWMSSPWSMPKPIVVELATDERHGFLKVRNYFEGWRKL
ncbi:MAG: hypothetical protein AAF555_05300, partial [Verrucomicrobiota bacterium]